MIGYTFCYFAGQYHWIPLDESVYALSYVPFDPRPLDGVWITAVALGVSLLATIYPARNATRITPVEVLAIRMTKPRCKAEAENQAERKARVQVILKALDEMYPDATCALIHRNPWELLVATILSAQCTDKRVNEVTPGLFAKYPTPRDFAAVRPEVLANDIRSTGFFNNKAKSIVGAAKKIVNEFGGKVPRTLEELITVPGAARKTANVVLGTAYNIASGVVVDTHVQRVSRRLDLTKQTDPVKIEQDLIKIIPAGALDSLLRTRSSIMAGRSASRANRNARSASSTRSVTLPTRRQTSWSK